MTRHVILGSAMIALIATGALGQAAPQPRAQPAPRLAPNHGLTVVPSAYPQTQALFDGYIRDDRMPGVVAAIGHGDAAPVYVSAGKIADDAGAANTGPDSLWRVYSMTKPITAMAAMILIEEGKLKLDQPIAELIPAFRTMTVQTSPDSLATRPATKPITVRNLLTHTAGLGYTIITKGPLLKEYERLGITPFTADARTEAQLRIARPKSLEEFANRVATLPLIAEPGTKWSYSIGLDVLGRVIEVASGMKFDAFLQQRIFTPLKMTSTTFSVAPADVSRFATGYVFIGDKRIPLDPAATSVFLQPPSFPYGGAGLVSSARDYDRFLHMLQNGGTLDGVRIMKPETAALAMSNLLPVGVTYPGAVAATGGTTTPQGFGAGGSVVITATPGGPSAGTYGWGGAAGTIAWVDPARQARATVMVNYLLGDKIPLRAESTRSIYADLAAHR